MLESIAMPCISKILIMIPKIKASNKFEAGPAAPTRAGPFF